MQLNANDGDAAMSKSIIVVSGIILFAVVGLGLSLLFTLERVALERELAGEMVSIPDGSFFMGNMSDCVEDEKQGDDLVTWFFLSPAPYDPCPAETPVHRVTVPAFKMGKHEVTVGQFRAFVVATGYHTDAERNAGGNEGCGMTYGLFRDEWARTGSSWRDPGYNVTDDRPVVCVSWNDAQAFIYWLNDKTDGNFRLPSEAEWEYAARAGSGTKYSWGNDIGTNRANCDGCGSQWDNDRTAPVGSFPANAWGLHDMHGNVWEWVQDCWHNNYEGAPTDGSARMNSDCGWRYVVIRGGSWGTLLRGLRSATRGRDDPTGRDYHTGFRLAQDE